MRKSLRNKLRTAALALPAVGVLSLFAYFLPPIRTRVDTRIDLWAAEIRYALNPPEEVIFIPQESQNQVDLRVTATLQALLPSGTPTATASPAPPTPTLPGPTPTATASPTPTATPTPLPSSVFIPGVEYQDQHGLWNYCGPANLAMAVSFWGWKTDRLEAGAYLRGGRARVDDKNVMPYEMQNFVHEQTGLRMIVRAGGEIELIKRLVAGGFPVILEKDFELPDIGWMGHYLLINGYDETSGEFITQDSYRGPNMRYDYETVRNSWRAFNYTFLVTYPPEREAEVLTLLGPWADERWANLHALEMAAAETISLSGRDLYFAWYNLGTSNVQLQAYGDAAAAYDTAFQLYAQLPSEERPWRMLWYQTGPYFAYYFTGRYYDVLNLADATLEAMKDPILEESFYWRALAKEALGDWEGALADMQESVRLNPNFAPGKAQLERMQSGG